MDPNEGSVISSAIQVVFYVFLKCLKAIVSFIHGWLQSADMPHKVQIVKEELDRGPLEQPT